MLNRLKIAILCIGTWLSKDAVAQDAQFSQFYSSALYLNPALAGAEPDLTFSSNYRQQWRSVPGVQAFTTNQVSLIVPYYVAKIKDSHKGGVGFSFFNDRAGDGNLKTLGVNLTGAYNIMLSHNGLHNLSFGLQGGFMQKSVDYSNLRWGSQYNPGLGFDPSQVPDEPNFVTTRMFADVNSGLMYYYNAGKNYRYTDMSTYVGVAAYHMNQPNESFVTGMNARLPMLLKAHAGLEYNVSTKVNLSPNAIFFYQHARYQLNAGMYLTYALVPSNQGTRSNTSLIFGAWYRLQDSFIFSVGLNGSFYTIAGSFDLNTSSLSGYSKGRGAYEVSLILRRNTKNRIKRFSTPRI